MGLCMQIITGKMTGRCNTVLSMRTLLLIQQLSRMILTLFKVTASEEYKPNTTVKEIVQRDRGNTKVS